VIEDTARGSLADDPEENEEKKLRNQLAGYIGFFKRQAQLPERTIRISMIIGLGFHLTWIFAILYLSFPAFYSTDAEVAEALRTLGVVTWVTSIAMMLLMAYFIERITFTIRRRMLQLFVAISMSLGTTLLVLAEFYYSIPLIIIADLLCGASSAFFYLIWSEAYRRRVMNSIVLNTAFAIAFAITLFGILFWLLPMPVNNLLLCVMPLAEVMALEVTLHGGRALTRPQRFEVDDSGKRLPALGLLEIPTFHRLRIKREMFLIKQGFPAFLLGLGMGPMCVQAFDMLLGMIERQENPVALIGFTSACIVGTVLVFIILNRDEKTDLFYQGIVPILAITMFFVSFVSDGFIFQLLSLLSYLFFVFLVWVEFCGLSHRYRISPILITGFGRAFALIGMLVSISALDNFMSSGIQLNSIVVNSCLIVTTLVGYLLLPREKHIREMSILEPLEVEQPQQPEESPEEFKQGRFIARCQRVANTYLLSSRESDVFFLLAKGRNAAYIAQNLFISEGTVHTHTWRIYRKLDIHTQQELMNLVDNYSLGNEDNDIRG